MPESGRSERRVRLVVGIVAAAGLLAVLGALLFGEVVPVPSDLPGIHDPGVFAIFVLLGVLAELVYVPLRHLDTQEPDGEVEDASEGLTFFEVAVVAGVLVLDPQAAVLAPLAAMALVCLLQMAAPRKWLYNLGIYGLATSLLVVVYFGLAQGAPRFSLQSVVALTLATFVFVAVNLIGWAELLHSVAGTSRDELLRDQWSLSAMMAIGGVGVGATSVLLAETAPVMLPFMALPAAALWYAFRSAGQHARERERNRWLVVVGAALAAQTSTDELLSVAPRAIQAAVGAPAVQVVLDGAHPLARRLTPGVTTLEPSELPAGWSYGVAVPLDVEGEGSGMLAVGEVSGGRSWRLSASDTPMLRTLVASLSSALRGSRDREALASETTKLKAVVEHATDGIVVISDDDVIQLWSPAMERISGIDAESASEPGPDRPHAARLLVAAAGLPGVLYEPGGAGETPPFPGLALPTRESLLLGLTRPDNEVRDVQVSIVRIQDDSEGRQVAILTVHDVTRERRVDRLKSDFVATITHELRTPITPIKGYAELLLHRGDELAPEKRQHALELIAERADHLGRLVDDLLLASRVSGEAPSGLVTRMADEDLAALVRAAVSAFPALEKRVELHVPDGPVIVTCDAARTKQCLSNLLSNAGKYAPGGTSIEVLLEVPDSGDHEAVISVRDHGPGIPAVEQDRIFDRFYRVGDPMTMTTGGSGLGLFIARELARAQGGDLTLKSSTGGGCTFALRVPLVRAEAASVPDPRTSPYPTARERS